MPAWCAVSQRNELNNVKTAFALCLASATAAVALLESTLPAQDAAVAKPAAAGIPLVTGDDYPGHLWQQTALALKELMGEDWRPVEPFLREA